MAVEQSGAPQEGQARLLQVLPHEGRVQSLEAVALGGEPDRLPDELQQVQDGRGLSLNSLQ